MNISKSKDYIETAKSKHLTRKGIGIFFYVASASLVLLRQFLLAKHYGWIEFAQWVDVGLIAGSVVGVSGFGFTLYTQNRIAFLVNLEDASGLRKLLLECIVAIIFSLTPFCLLLFNKLSFGFQSSSVLAGVLLGGANLAFNTVQMLDRAKGNLFSYGCLGMLRAIALLGSIVMVFKLNIGILLYVCLEITITSLVSLIRISPIFRASYPGEILDALYSTFQGSGRWYLSASMLIQSASIFINYNIDRWFAKVAFSVAEYAKYGLIANIVLVGTMLQPIVFSIHTPRFVQHLNSKKQAAAQSSTLKLFCLTYIIGSLTILLVSLGILIVQGLFNTKIPIEVTSILLAGLLAVTRASDLFGNALFLMGRIRSSIQNNIISLVAIITVIAFIDYIFCLNMKIDSLLVLVLAGSILTTTLNYYTFSAAIKIR